MTLWTFVCVRDDLNSKWQYQKLITMNMSDPTSQSNYNIVTSDHVEFKWWLDFDRRIVQGVATHCLIIKEDNANEVMFVLFFDIQSLDSSQICIIQIRHERFVDKKYPCRWKENAGPSLGNLTVSKRDPGTSVRPGTKARSYGVRFTYFSTFGID